MCTLTYRLTESGYELFFNRDEQRSREQAIPPVINQDLKAIYPIDPMGKGTWIAVHESGLSIALLNYYQAEKKAAIGSFNSRGEIIVSLLQNPQNVLQNIHSLALHQYQAFQLCVFLPEFSLNNNKMYCFQWDGVSLNEVNNTLPITSSGVDYEQVYDARKKAFDELMKNHPSSTENFINYHHWQQESGKLSVKMSREDAQTVSFSHISVASSNDCDIQKQISFRYLDYLISARNNESVIVF